MSTRTITKTFESADTLRNVHEDLINKGLTEELIFLDKKSKQVKVTVPKVVEHEIEEILERHNPID